MKMNLEHIVPLAAQAVSILRHVAAFLSRFVDPRIRVAGAERFPRAAGIVSEAARLRYRSNGQFTCPLVVRMPTGGGIFDRSWTTG
jgi:hypothetical protein